MNIRIQLMHCRRLIDDIDNSEIIDFDYLMPHILRSAAILFSAEVEDNFKNLIAAALKHYPFSLHNKSLDEIRRFLKTYKEKSRNPKFRDIKEISSFFGIYIDNILSDEEKQMYSNIITNRDRLSHDPRESVNFTLQDFKRAVEVAEKLLTFIANSLFSEITNHIKSDFAVRSH